MDEKIGNDSEINAEILGKVHELTVSADTDEFAFNQKEDTAMSRSYKKNPIVKDHSGGMKNVANRKVRRRLKSARFGLADGRFELANGRAYRKVFCSWCICDWRVRETYGKYLADAEAAEKDYLNGMCQPAYYVHNRFLVSYKDYSFWDWYKRYKRK